MATLLQWTWLRFDDLGVRNLYDLLALRCAVFVLEQGPYQDPDGKDRDCWHLLGRDSTGMLQAYLPLADPSVNCTQPSIGRVVTSRQWRGHGAGKALVAEGVQRTMALWPGHGIRISAGVLVQVLCGVLLLRSGRAVPRRQYPSPGNADRSAATCQIRRSQSWMNH